MLQTIQTGTHISIQGEFVRKYPDGNIMVRVGPAYYVGKPVVPAMRAVPEKPESVSATAN